MFESIEELEREVQEFRKNILASSELVANLERMVALAKEQSRAFETASAELKTSIEKQTADLQRQMQMQMQKQVDLSAEQKLGFDTAMQSAVEATSNQMAEVTRLGQAGVQAFDASTQALSAHVEKLTANMEQRIGQQMDAQSKAFDDQTKAYQEAARGLTETLIQQSKALGVKAESTFSAHTERLASTNQAQIQSAVNAMENTGIKFAATCDDAKKSVAAVQESLNARYEQVLEKLEAANVTETVRLSKTIIKSMNIKFGVLLTGVIASIVIAVLAYLK